MNKLKIFFILLTITFQQCQSLFLWDFIWNNYLTNKDSIKCYQKITVKFLQQLQEVPLNTGKCNLQDNINSFESEVQPRLGMTNWYMLVTKDGRNKDLFNQKMRSAEGIVNGAITEFEKCLKPECVTGAKEKIKYAITTLKERSIKCGDASYLNVPLTSLEQVCSKLKKAASPISSSINSILSPLSFGQLSVSEITDTVADITKRFTGHGS